MGKLTDETALTGAANGDFLYVVDVSNTTEDPAGSSFKITLGELLLSVGIKVVAGFEGYVILAATGNTDSTIVQQDDILVGKGAFFSGDYVMMRATQDSPTLDAHFAVGVNGDEL